MLELPRYHVAREALREALDAAPVVAIEAASGFGKSTLAAELTCGDRRVVDITLSGQETGRHALLLPLARALRRAGEMDAASALGELAATPIDALDAMLDALHGSDPLTVVIDDAHHLGDEAGLLCRLAAGRPPALRLIMTARALPPAASKLRSMPGVEHVGAGALRFDADQTARLLRDGFGLEVEEDRIEELTVASDGWPAALAFVGSQMQRSGSMNLQAEGASGFSDLVVAALPASLRDPASQLALLPWLDDALAEAASGHPWILRELIDAGVPLTLDSDGTYRLPGAVADALSRGTALDPQVAGRAAAYHLRRGRAFEALAVLRRARDWSALAALVVDLPPEARRHLTADELIGMIDAVPDEVQRSYPWVLVDLARALARAGIPEKHHDVLERAVRGGEGLSDDFVRAVEVQRLNYDIYTLDRDEVAKRVAAVIEEAGAGEERTVARALVLEGMLGAWQGRRDEARRSLRRSAGMFVDAGEPYEAARALMQLGFTVELHGDLRVAEATFQEAVDLAGNDARARATALTYLGEIKVWLGRPDEGVDDLEAALTLARAVRDDRAQAYAAWGLALHASLQVDREATVARVNEAERLLSSWLDTGVGATFMATMVDLLDRAGAHEEADDMLDRVRPRRDEQPELVALAEFVVAARRGDPAEAERLWPGIESDDGLELFERVRCRYLRAYAALRGSDPAVETMHRQAVAEAEAIGLPDLPQTLEPVAAAAFREWEGAARGMWAVLCLGPLLIERGEQAASLPVGKPSALVGFLAVSKGPQRVTRVIDVLWPDVSEADGRVRLRQVLYRLRAAVPDLVVRVGDDHLGLADGVLTDLERFEDLSDAATAGGNGADEAARRAVALYRGPVLADLPLDGEWADLEVVREWARGRYLSLLDLLSRVARRDGDITAAVMWARQAHGADPTDERRAMELAGALVGLGRIGDAGAALAVSAAALRELGVEPSPALTDEASRLRRASR